MRKKKDVFFFIHLLCMFLDILHLDISEYGSNFIQTLSNGTIKNVAKSYFDRKTEIS